MSPSLHSPTSTPPLLNSLQMDSKCPAARYNAVVPYQIYLHFTQATALQSLPPSTPPLSHKPEVTVLQQPPSNPTATLEPVDTEDRRETELFAQFLASGCTCGRPCMSQFTQDHVLDSWRDCQELSRDKLDMVVLGQLHGSMNLSESCGPNHKHKAAQRQRSSVAYTHRGKPVCAKVFRFLHGVGMTH